MLFSQIKDWNGNTIKSHPDNLENIESLLQTTEMCHSVIVIKRVCRWGHLNDWTTCWALCEDQARANYDDDNFDRLCDKADEVEFKEIKSYAKEDTSKRSIEDCEVCLSLSLNRDRWDMYQQALRAKETKFAECEKLRDILTARMAEATNRPGSRDSIAQWNSLLEKTLEDCATFKGELDDARDHTDRVDSLYADEASVGAVYQRLRTLEYSRWRGTDTRRFFFGDINEDEANIGKFETGKFDVNLIREYPQRYTFFPTEVGHDLSPPGGVIGELSTDQMFKDWQDGQKGIASEQT